jgi:hypothetical protein
VGNDQTILSDEELSTLIQSLGRQRGTRGFNDLDIDALTKWALDVRIGASMLELVLKGMVEVGIEDGEPVFQVSELGKAAAKVLEQEVDQAHA